MSNLRTEILNLAKQAVESFIKNNSCLAPEPKEPDLKKAGACFVCLKKNGQLRGCIGTLKPSTASLAEEIIKNAIAAATCDRRFNPVTEDELASIEYSIDVLSPLEKSAKSALDAKKYGILVSAYGRTGVLLPDLEGVESVEEQLRIAKFKAGLSENDNVEIFRFTVTRYK